LAEFWDLSNFQLIVNYKPPDMKKILLLSATFFLLTSGISPDGTITNRIFTKEAKKSGLFSAFHLGGFALGFFLCIIGVLIAYLINEELKARRVKWAWIGAIISLIFYGALLI